MKFKLDKTIILHEGKREVNITRNDYAGRIWFHVK